MKKNKTLNISISKLLIGFLLSFVLAGLMVIKPNSLVDAGSPPYTATWWNAVCDTQHYSGSQPLPNNGPVSNPWNGLYACGPRPEDIGYDVYQHESFGGGAQQWEWECTELVERYMYLAWGVIPYAADGDTVMSSYNTNTEPSTVVPVTNNGTNRPSIGDVLSYNGNHTSIIVSGPNSQGYYTVFQQNAQYTSTSQDVYIGSNGQLTSSWEGSINGWLHYTGGIPANIKVTSGISSTNPVTMGGNFSASYTVTNSGSSNFNLTELSLWGQDPNGNTFKIYGDNDGGGNIYVGANSTRTLTANLTNFASNCSNCVSGNYNIIAEY